MHTFFRKIQSIQPPSFWTRWPKWVRWTALGVVIALIAATTGIGIVKAQQSKTAAASASTLQTATARQGTLTLEASGTGYLVAADEASVGFDVSGRIVSLNVKLGDSVKKGDLLAVLDDSSEQTALANAKQTLAEMTSPEAVANAKLAITSAQADVTTATIALSQVQNWKNDALIQDYYAKYVVAKANLDRAQAAYDKANVGEYLNNADEAQLYQSLYNAQQAYNTAKYYYSLYSQKPTQRQIDEAQATLDLAKANLANAQNYLTAITGGDVPTDATGSQLASFRAAQASVETAQENLDATKLYAPISGTVMTLNAGVGDSVSGSFLTIDDLSQATIQFYMDSGDWTNVKVGYTVNVSFDALSGQVFTGKVTQVMPGLVTVQGSSMVEGFAQLDQSVEEIGLPVGVEASIDVISGQAENAVLVPVEALHQLSDGSYTIFVMADGKPTLRVVEVGLKDETYAEITSGLKAGEVVTTGVVETTK
jgi:HlyD family secretion protein